MSDVLHYNVWLSINNIIRLDYECHTFFNNISFYVVGVLLVEKTEIFGESTDLKNLFLLWFQYHMYEHVISMSFWVQ